MKNIVFLSVAIIALFAVNYGGYTHNEALQLTGIFLGFPMAIMAIYQHSLFR